MYKHILRRISVHLLVSLSPPLSILVPPLTPLPGVMSENQFLIFMRSLTDFRDHEIIEIFDIFDYDYVGGIAFDEVGRSWGLIEWDLVDFVA